jgi:hypothetical protein
LLPAPLSHRLADGDPIQITGVGGTTTVNTVGYAKVTGQSTTTFAFYSDAALSAGITGTGSYTSGGAVSFAYDISGITTDWTLRFIVESLTSTKKVLVAVEESADGFVADIRQILLVNVQGPITPVAPAQYSVRSYERPSARFGVSNARLRVKLLTADSPVSLISSTWVEY